MSCCALKRSKEVVVILLNDKLSATGEDYNELQTRTGFGFSILRRGELAHYQFAMWPDLLSSRFGFCHVVPFSDRFQLQYSHENAVAF